MSEPFWDGMLQPGQMLYIPTGWWHYVKAASLSASGGDDAFLGTRQDVSVPSSPPGHVLVGVCQSHSGVACYSLVRCCTSPQVGGTMSRQLPSASLSASGGDDAFLGTGQDVNVHPPFLL